MLSEPKKIIIEEDEKPTSKKPIYKEPTDKNPQENEENIDDILSNTKQIKSIKINSKNSKTIDDYLMELQNMIGLESVKKEINSIINFIRVNQMKIEKGLETYDLSYHMVFTGNPGTGKTTVARILANIFKELNIVSVGSYFEVDRSGLVAGYMGQTALKVKSVLDEAKGGVLFIDEAYSLVNDGSQSDYGKEAIDTLLKYMEDYRHDLIVIVAGYSDLMKNFINSNPGLKSRFNRFINFEDYTPDELLEILKIMSAKSHYSFSEKAIVYLKKFFTTVYQTDRERFGNGRGVRNLFEKILTFHADRMSNFVVPSDELLCVIVAEDVVKAIKEILRNKI
jgi:SpoVK/Ycf46/Vps4 family AAA+-type ATPase